MKKKTGSFFEKYTTLYLISDKLIYIIISLNIISSFIIIFMGKGFTNSPQPKSIHIYVVYILIPYIIGFWVTFKNIEHIFQVNNLKPISKNDPNYCLFSKWIEPLHIRNISFYYYEEEHIEALTFGTSNHHFIALSNGALANLNKTELKALFFHEMGHLKYNHYWKLGIARNITKSVVATQILFEILALPTNIFVNDVTLIQSLPILLPGLASIGFFCIAMIGNIFLTRLYEDFADIYAIENGINKNELINLTLKINAYSTNSSISKENKKLLNFKIPNIFKNHYSKRKIFFSVEDTIFAHSQNMSIFFGLLLGAFIGWEGRYSIYMSFSLPIITIFGSLFFYHLLKFIDSYQNLSKLIFVYTSISSISAISFNLFWVFVRRTSEYTYEISQFQSFIGSLLAYIDMHIVILIFSNICIFLISIFLYKVSIWIKKKSYYKKNLHKGVPIIIWFCLSLMLFLHWFNAFGPYPVFQFANNMN